MLTAFIWVPWLSRFMTVCSCVLNSHHISHYNLCQHRIFRNQHIVYTCQVVSIQLLQVANLKTVSQNWDNVVCIQVSETRIWCLHVKQIFKKKNWSYPGHWRHVNARSMQWTQYIKSMTSVTDADFALFMFSNFYTHKSLYKTLKKAEKNKKA